MSQEEQIESYRKGHFLTVGKLKEYMAAHQLDDDALILMQRVEDVYFEKHNWITIKKEGENWHSAKSHNEKVDTGVYSDKEEYPNMTDDFNKKYDAVTMEFLKDEYYPCWCPVIYPNDKNLYLDAHY